MRASDFLGPLLFAAASLAQAVPEGIAPSSAPPNGCQTTVSGSFQIGTLENFSSSSQKRAISEAVRTPLPTYYPIEPGTNHMLYPGSRWRCYLHLERRHPARSIQPHRLDCRESTIPVRWATTSGRHLHRRLLSLQERLTCTRRLGQVVAVYERQLWKSLRHMDWIAMPRDSHPGYFPGSGFLECCKLRVHGRKERFPYYNVSSLSDCFCDCFCCR